MAWFISANLLNNTGITVVMVTYEPEVASQTKRIVWFRDGEVIHSNLTPDDLSVSSEL